MRNMSYCRIENTYWDLKEFYDVLQEARTLEALEKDISENEKQFLYKLIDLCNKISEEFD